VPEAEARAILVRAFLTEAIDAVTDETIRAWLESAVAGWWEKLAA
jgi:Fe-S cluster assembly protein SufD